MNAFLWFVVSSVCLSKLESVNIKQGVQLSIEMSDLLDFKRGRVETFYGTLFSIV